MSRYCDAASVLSAYMSQIDKYAEICAIAEWVPILIRLSTDVLPRINITSARKIQELIPAALGQLSNANLAAPDQCHEAHENLMYVLEHMYEPLPAATFVDADINNWIVAMTKDYARLLTIRIAESAMADIHLAILNTYAPDTPDEDFVDPVIADNLAQFVRMARQYSYFETMGYEDYIAYAVAMCAATMYIADRGNWHNTARRTTIRLGEIHCPAILGQRYADRAIDWCQQQLAVAEIVSYRLPCAPAAYALPDPCSVSKRGREDQRIGTADNTPRRRPRGQTHH